MFRPPALLRHCDPFPGRCAEVSFARRRGRFGRADSARCRRPPAAKQRLYFPNLIVYLLALDLISYESHLQGVCVLT
jgi:hypothetical protein